MDKFLGLSKIKNLVDFQIQFAIAFIFLLSLFRNRDYLTGTDKVYKFTLFLFLFYTYMYLLFSKIVNRMESKRRQRKQACKVI